MKKLNLFTLLIASACTFQACQNSEKNTSDTTLASDSTLDTIGTNAENELLDDETAFFQQAALGGMMELEAANWVLQKSKDAKVKEFAQMMITDHTKANKELQQLATNKGLQLPATFMEEQQKHLDALKEFSDVGLDRTYSEMMVTDHKKTIDLFNKAISFQDPDIRAFANRTLPVLKKHYQHATELNNAFQKKRMNNGQDNSNVERDAKKPS
jgi:putative membrane protein